MSGALSAVLYNYELNNCTHDLGLPRPWDFTSRRKVDKFPFAFAVSTNTPSFTTKQFVHEGRYSDTLAYLAFTLELKKLMASSVDNIFSASVSAISTANSSSRAMTSCATQDKEISSC